MVAKRTGADILEAVHLGKSETEELAKEPTYSALVESNPNVDGYVPMKPEASNRSSRMVNDWSPIRDDVDTANDSTNHPRTPMGPVVINTENNSAKSWDPYNRAAPKPSY